MTSIKKSIEASDEVKVKDETICYTEPISQTKKAPKVKEEPIDIEIKTSKSHIDSRSEEVKVKAEEKFSVTEELVNKASITFLNEETTNQATTSKSNHVNKQKSK